MVNMSATVYVAGKVITILIKRITSENRKRFPVYRFRVCKCKNVSADEKKDGQPNSHKFPDVSCHCHLYSFPKVIGREVTRS